MGGGASVYTEPREVDTKYFPEFVKALPNQRGKVVAVTGCTTGTGYILARTAARLGATVIMLNRDSSRADTALRSLENDTNKYEQFDHVTCDLTDFESVRSAAAYVNKKYADRGLDVLCCNAGVMALRDEATGDGYDVQMQTNHLSHFLLVKELYPLLLKAESIRGEARVVTHSSFARMRPKKKVESKYYGKNGGDLGGDGASMFLGGARWVRYNQTKLANCLFAQALGDRFANLQTKQGKNMKSVVCAPGLVATNLQVATALDGGFHSSWIMRFSQSREDGTMPLAYSCFHTAACNMDFYEPTNNMRMVGDVKKYELEKHCKTEEGKGQLWEHAEAAVGKFDVN